MRGINYSPNSFDWSSVVGGSESGLSTAAAGGFNPIADAIGIGELFSSVANSKKAQTLRPTAVDPMEQDFYNTLDNLRKGETTGSAFNTAMKGLQDQTSIANKAITDRAGGYGGGAIAGLSLASGQEGDSFAELMADAEKERNGILSMEGNEASQIASRKGAIQEQDYLQAQQNAANQKQSGFSNLLGGTAGTGDVLQQILKLLGNKGGGTTSFAPINGNLNLSTGSTPTLGSLFSSGADTPFGG